MTKSERNKAWRESNKERLRAYHKDYYKSNRAHLLEQARIYRENNKEDLIEYRRRHPPKRENKINNNLKQYGIDIETYEKIFAEQNGLCAICSIDQNKLRKALFLDHDHKTGRVRGLLCPKCNTALGLVDDSIETLTKLIEYLKG